MRPFADYAFDGIRKHPEIFSALEEFERTKKVPKLAPRRRIDITIDEHVLRHFRAYCRERGVSLSRAVEECMKEKIAPQAGRLRGLVTLNSRKPRISMRG